MRKWKCPMAPARNKKLVITCRSRVKASRLVAKTARGWESTALSWVVARLKATCNTPHMLRNSPKESWREARPVLVASTNIIITRKEGSSNKQLSTFTWTWQRKLHLNFQGIKSGVVAGLSVVDRVLTARHPDGTSRPSSSTKRRLRAC